MSALTPLLRPPPPPSPPPPCPALACRSYLKEREKGFDLDFGVRAAEKRHTPGYDALRDRNMRHYFEGAVVQDHLLRTVQVSFEL